MPNMVLTTRRDPFAAFDTVIRRAFPTSPRWTLGPIPAPTAGPAFSPAVEVVKDGEDAVVRVDLPGIDLAKDVAVEVDNGRLVIKGERRDERAEETATRTVREVRYGSFRRVFTLPERLAADAVSATYDSGVLIVRIAGAYAIEEPRKIAVTAAAAAAPSAPSALDAEDADAATPVVDAVEPMRDEVAEHTAN